MSTGSRCPGCEHSACHGCKMEIMAERRGGRPTRKIVLVRRRIESKNQEYWSPLILDLESDRVGLGLSSWGGALSPRSWAVAGNWETEARARVRYAELR